MNYEIKYYKYKTKYIELKNKISGGSLPKIQNYKITHIENKSDYVMTIIIYNGKNLFFNNYKILISGDIEKEKVNICLTFSSEIIKEVNIFIKNVSFTRNKKKRIYYRF
jgi:hypothetical protein